MAEQAKVTSVDAIDAFRANLILYVKKARPTLEEVTNEVNRTQQWLQVDQRRHWEKELKQRRKFLERAQAELFSAMMSNLQDASAAQQMAVRHAQQAVREAEAKLGLLKRWDRELENRSEPLIKQVNQLHTYFTADMSRALAYLTQVLKALENYSAVAPPSGTPPPADAPAAPETAAPEDEGEKTS